MAALDLFIGEPEYLGKGIGKEMLKKYVHGVIVDTYPHKDSVYICQDINNEAALATSMSAGFKFVRNLLEEGRDSLLLMKTLR